MAPRSHNLIFLSEKANLTFDDDDTSPLISMIKDKGIEII